jgi:putative tributyrin esterase
MALMHTHFYSTILNLSCSMDVIIPESHQGVGITASSPTRRNLLPVLYLLHGLSDDHTIWQRRTSIERYAAQYQLAVVMPAVHRSFYTDQKTGYRYFSYLSEELMTKVPSFFHVSPLRKDTFAAGLSMGGYGALKLGLRLPDRFAAVASLSGATDMTRLFDAAEPERRAETQMIFGSYETYKDSSDDLFALAEKTASSNHPKPSIFMACGTKDALYRDNLRFRPHLEQLGYTVTWSEKDNIGHEWAYWDEVIQEVLEWLPLDSR